MSKKDKCYILKERRERSLELLNALFNKMLIDYTISPEIYERMFRQAERDVDNFYRYVFGKKPINYRDTHIIKEVEKILEGFPIKKQHEAIEVDKIIKHSIQIVNELEEEYDTIVNILFGGIELGFALKSISRILNKPINSEIVMVRYSLYDEHDKRIHVPYVLEHKLPEGKKILIMDDSVGTGRTLRRTKHFFEYLGNEVDITATEISYKYIENVKNGIKKGEVIDLKELKFESGIPYRKR